MQFGITGYSIQTTKLIGGSGRLTIVNIHRTTVVPRTRSSITKFLGESPWDEAMVNRYRKEYFMEYLQSQRHGSNPPGNGMLTQRGVGACEAGGNGARTRHRLIATFGVDNLVIGETPDVTLVCRKDKASEVRALVSELKRRGWEQYL